MIWYGIAVGICLSAGVIQLALGLQRPVRATHITFALMMAVMCPFQLAVAALHTATSFDSAVAIARAGVALAIAFITLYGVFLRQYTGIAVPRAVVFAFFAGNAAWLAFDLIAPQGLLFATVVRPHPAAPGAVPRVPPAAVLLGWHLFNVATVLWAAAVGWHTARGGRWRQGVLLVVGAAAVLVTVSADFFRDLLGASWPYLGGFGATALALVLSTQLALDFRNNEILLARMLGGAMRVRDQLNTPLQTLRIGLEVEAVKGRIDETTITRLRRAVERLTALGRDLRA